jgi:dCTP deaminase
LILTGKEIEKRLNKDIIIEPFDKEQLNPNSYDVRLHEKLLVYEDAFIDAKKPLKTSEIIIPEAGLLLHSNTLYLGRTLEYTETKKLVPMIVGKSSVGRLGVCIHVTAGFGDIGFRGYWTLEISCIYPTIVYPNMKIGQLYYQEIIGEYEEYQSEKYQNNTGVQPSLIYKDFE